MNALVEDEEVERCEGCGIDREAETCSCWIREGNEEVSYDDLRGES